MSANGVPWEVAPAVQRVGLGYRAEFPSDVRLAVSRLRESRGEVHGELSAEHQGTHLYRGSMNLSGMNSRKSAAQYLQGQTNGANLPWPSILEHFCVGVLDQQRQGDPFECVEGATYQRRPMPPRLLPILIEGMPTIIFGPGDAGKSTLAAGLAVSAATGLPLMPGWMPLRRTPVVILDWENSRDTWGDMFHGVAVGMGVSMPNFVYRRYHRPLADEIEPLTALVAERQIGLVIVDAVHAASGSGRDGGDAAETTMRLFAALAHLGPVTTLLIDHVAGGDVGQDRKETTKPYGSVFKLWQARSVYELRGAPATDRANERELMLIHHKFNAGPKDQRRGLRSIHEDGGQTIRFRECTVEAAELVDRLPVVERMHRLLMAGPLTTKEIAEELDVAWATVRQNVARRHDRFQKFGDGRVGLAFRGADL